MLQPILELDRFTSPSKLPHAVACENGKVYISSRETQRIDVIDRTSWKKTGEVEPPGMPWGLTFANGELLMTCGETAEDLRRVRRYRIDEGWRDGFVAAPDDTGSHLAVYEDHVLLGQWYNQALLLVDDSGAVLRRWHAPHGIAGVTVRGDDAYLVGTDDEDAGEYWVTRLSLQTGDAEDVALIPFHARGLFWDGDAFWTNFRAGDRVIRFALPA